MANKLTDEQFYAQMDKIKQLSGFNPFEGFADELYKQVGNQNPVSAFINNFSPEARAQIMQPMEQQVQQMPEVPYTNDGTFQSLAGSSQTGGHDIYSGSDPTDYGVAGGEQVSNSDKWIAENAVGGMNILAQPEKLASGLLDIGSGYYQKATGDTTNQEQVDLANNTTQQFQEMFTPEGLHKGPDALGLAAGGTYLAGKAGGWAGNKLASSGINDKIDAVVNDNPGLFPTELGGKSNMVEPGINPKTGIDELGFYSEAENVLNKLKQETNHPDHIKQFMQKNGVTAEELTNTGLTKLLKDKAVKGEMVTKAEMLGFLRGDRLGEGKTKFGTVEKSINEEFDADAEYADYEMDNPEIMQEQDGNFNVTMDFDEIDSKTKEFMIDGMENGDTTYEELTGIYSQMGKLDPEAYPRTSTQHMSLGEMGEDLYPDWWKKIDEAMGNNPEGAYRYDELPEKVKMDFEAAVYKMKTDEYLEDPLRTWIVGNDDGGYYEVNGSEGNGYTIIDPEGSHVAYVDSIGEANLRIRDDAVGAGYIDHGEFGQGNTRYLSNTQDGVDEDSYREVLITADPVVSRPLDIGNEFGGDRSHWKEKNVIAHLRHSDKVDADGKKVLFIEEIQSDWHQQARRYGVTKEENMKAIKKYEAKVEKLQTEFDDISAQKKANEDNESLHKDVISPIHDEMSALEKKFREITGDKDIFDTFYGPEIVSEESFLKRDWDRLRQETKDIVQARNKKKRSLEKQEAKLSLALSHAEVDVTMAKKGPVANPPLKNKKWQEMAMKRAVKIATDGGYDRVAWTSAEQQIATWGKNQTELFTNIYDKNLPSIANTLADKHGSQTGKTKIDFTDNEGMGSMSDNNKDIDYIDITPELSKGIKSGQSAYGSTSVAKPKKVTDGLLDQASNSYVKTLMKHDGYKGTIADYKKNFVSDGLLKQEPLTVYRSSTSGSYDKFDKSKQKSALLGQGVYMFDNKKSANDWVGGNLQKIELPYDYMEKSINWGDGGQSDFVTKAFKKIEKEVDFKLDLEDGGIDVYPELVKKLGEDKAQALLSKHGIYGNRRDYGNKKDQELTIFNVDDAKIISTDKKKPKNGLLD